MIQVIDGKRYNTETAFEVYCYENRHMPHDFHYREKRLYITRKGSWFFYHYGGAMTDMAVSVGSNGTGGSESIEPVTDDDAFGFLEKHSDELDARTALEKYFSDRIDDA